MKKLTNQPNGYYQVERAEDLQFAFADISEDINIGSKIVINIACPVDVIVSYGDEKLSSAEEDYQDTASFGTLQLLGKDKDIKVLSLDGDKDYNIEIFGTGEGTMDYTVNYYDEKKMLLDTRTFEAVPITQTTVITSQTDTTVENMKLNMCHIFPYIKTAIFELLMKNLALFAKTYYSKEIESVRRSEMCEVINMDMMTVQQMAEKWGVSVRYVQVLCKKGKLSGAVKFGLNWMIPADAERPKDGRYKENKAEPNAAPKIVMPVQSPLMTLSPFYNKPGDADKCIELLAGNPETQKLFAGELAFLQGDIPKALEIVLPLLDVDADFYGTLNVGMFLSALGVWRNDNILWKKGRERMSSAPCSDDMESRIRDLWLAITDVSISENKQNLAPSSWNEFNRLPADSVPAYLFYYAKHMHKLGVAVAREEVELSDIQRMGVLRMFPYLGEPLIAQVHDSGSVLSEIYLHFLCADAYNKIGVKEKFEQHLEIAVSLCLPDKLYGVLAECRGLLGTVLDECLERKDAEAARKVKKLEKQMYANWMEMVNQTADIGLSDRQKEIARLASIGLSNEEIADHLQISYNTVKSTITMIMNKTGTSKRSEFAPYIF